MKILRKIKGKLLASPPPAPVDTRKHQLMAILDDGLGHRLSAESQKPVDAAGNPLPWFTYPAIEYLQQLNFANCSVLEWGIGNSSRFFAARCKDIISIEHNADWYHRIAGDLPANATALLADAGSYAKVPLERKQLFDVIIVDGIERAACLETAVKLVTENGMIIFDNSERNPELCEYLRSHDLIEIDFAGFGPINPYAWTTSLFLKRGWNLKPATRQPIVPAGGGY